MQRSILLVLALLLCPSLALARTWTNKEGKEIVADFVDATQEKVTLKKSDGKIVTFKLELLSEEDQRFIRGILARRVGKTTAPSEEADNPFQSVPSSTKPATDLRGAVESKGSDEKVEGLGTMRDVNESKKKMKPENREWTDAFGNKSSGKFIRLQGNNVLVLRSNKQVALDYWQLSDADKDYLKELGEANGWSQLIPKFNPAEQRNSGANVAGNAAGSGPTPGISNGPSSPPAGAFAGAAGAGNSSPPGGVSSPRIGDPQELARRLRELEEKAKAAASYSPAPSSATASGPAFPSPGGTSYSPPPSASASYSPPPSASASYSPPPGVSSGPTPGASYSPPSMGSSAMPSSTIPGSSMPGSSMPGSSIPSIPDPTFGMPSMSLGEKECGSCGKVLPASFTAGDSCPSCGVYFSHDDTNGKTANPGFFGGGGGGGGGARGGGGGGGGMSRGAFRGIALLVVLAIKAVAFMAWRSQQS